MIHTTTNGVIGTPGGMSAWARLSRQGGVELGNHVSLEEAQELQRRVHELESQLEESEKNYADIHKAWTDASRYYSKMEEEVQTAHENYLKEKDWFDTSLKEKHERIQKLEESLETSMSDADRLTRIVSNYEKELFKLKKDGTKVSDLEKTVSELESALQEARKEGKERLAMCEKMEEEANMMIAQAEEALGNIIREKEALQEREEEVAAEKKACEELVKELEKSHAENVPKTSTTARTIKGETRGERVQSKTTRGATATKKKDEKEMEDNSNNNKKKKNNKETISTEKSKARSPRAKTQQKKTAAPSPKSKDATGKKKVETSVKQKRTKKAPSVQKTTTTKATKKKEVTPAVSETASTRTRSGRTVKRKTFADD